MTEGNDALLERRVVESAAQVKDTSKLPLLPSDGHELVFECLAHSLCVDSHPFCLIDTKAARTRTSGLNQQPPHCVGYIPAAYNGMKPDSVIFGARRN